eukprot:COSAG04_NODE_1876_length_5329_cov_70.433078_4_plen_64_part_00
MRHASSYSTSPARAWAVSSPTSAKGSCPCEEHGPLLVLRPFSTEIVPSDVSTSPSWPPFVKDK